MNFIELIFEERVYGGESVKLIIVICLAATFIVCCCLRMSGLCSQEEEQWE